MLNDSEVKKYKDVEVFKGDKDTNLLTIKVTYIPKYEVKEEGLPKVKTYTFQLSPESALDYINDVFTKNISIKIKLKKKNIEKIISKLSTKQFYENFK